MNQDIEHLQSRIKDLESKMKQSSRPAEPSLSQLKHKKDQMKQRITSLNESMSKKIEPEVSDEFTLNNIEINELAQQRALMKKKLESLNHKFNKHNVLEEQSATS